jgi:hypothetical protein
LLQRLPLDPASLEHALMTSAAAGRDHWDLTKGHMSLRGTSLLAYVVERWIRMQARGFQARGRGV